jgi:hypothetical protein
MAKTKKENKEETKDCLHQNLKQDGARVFCADCGQEIK